MSKFTYLQISPSHRLSISSLSSLSSDPNTFLTITDPTLSPPPSTYPTIPSSYSPTSTDLVYGVLLLQYSLLPYSSWTKDDSKEVRTPILIHFDTFSDIFRHLSYKSKLDYHAAIQAQHNTSHLREQPRPFVSPQATPHNLQDLFSTMSSEYIIPLIYNTAHI